VKNKFLSKQHFIGETALIIVTLLWGGTFVIVKESLNDISAMTFIALRFSIAFVLLLPFIIKYRRKFNKGSVIAGFVLGVFLFLGFGTQTVGLQYTTATKSAFLTGTAVVLVPVLQVLIEKRSPSPGSLIGIVFVFTGILFLSSEGNSIVNLIEEVGKNFNIGDLLTLICALFFAIYIIYLDIVSSEYPFSVLLTMQIITTAVLAYFASFIFNSFSIEKTNVNFSNTLIFGLIYTSIFATLITTAMQTRFQKYVTPTKAGIIYSLEPIFASILAFFLLNEKITNFGLAGAVLIISGLVISEIYDSGIKNER